MGSAVWEFMWCLDKITKVEKEIGYVLGGKPINLSDLANQLGTVEMTTSRNLERLEEYGYITKLRTPYGIVIKVMKAKKRFNKNVDSIGLNKNVESPNRNVESNKIVSVDSISIDSSEPSSQEITEVIEAFKPVNPSYQRFFPNKTQRAAVIRLLKVHGLVQVLKVISWLPQCNGWPYFPTITAPTQLEDKWAQLESASKKKKQELTDKKPKVII
jgi:DNA-binding Lrp family transcriptional regulator